MAMNFSDFADFVAQIKRAMEIEQEVGELEKHLAEVKASVDSLEREKEAKAAEMADAIRQKADAEQAARVAISDANVRGAAVEDEARKRAAKIVVDAEQAAADHLASVKDESDAAIEKLKATNDEIAKKQVALNEINEHLNAVKARVS
jgi:hypothetical protein